ncbi:hypothetical protein [Bacillus sp. FJAT-27264]|nr:hypothetical protein [Bacillus sp. FJAT-27264]
MGAKRTLFTTAALGAVYLLRNKKTRDKLIDGIQSVAEQIRSRRPGN